MQRWIRRFLERLTQRVMVVVTAKVEAQLELELAEVRAELLEQAASYQGDAAGPVAERLTQASSRLGELDLTQDRLGLAEESDAETGHGSNTKERPGSVLQKTKSSGAAANRGRGRPRKVPDAAPLNLTADSPLEETPFPVRQSDGQ